MNWLNIILAAVSAYYFGWVQGRKEVEKGIKAGEIVIDGQKIQLPGEVYNQIRGILEGSKLVSLSGLGRTQWKRPVR